MLQIETNWRSEPPCRSNHHKGVPFVVVFVLGGGEDEGWGVDVGGLGDRGGDGIVGITVHHDGVDIGKLGKAVHAASVNLAGVHEGDALTGGTDHSRFGLGHLGKVGRKAAAGDKGAGAHDGQIGVDHLERLHSERSVQITMAFAQRPARHDDID